MPKFKIAVTLPHTDDLIEGLSLDEHPPFRAAREALAKAQTDLADGRADVARLGRLLEGAPERVRRGEVRADVIASLVAQRDAAALRIAELELDVERTRKAVPVAQRAAHAALAKAIDQRRDVLRRAAHEVGPLLEALLELDRALNEARRVPGASPFNRVDFIGEPIAWPASPRDAAKGHRANETFAAAARRREGAQT